MTSKITFISSILVLIGSFGCRQEPGAVFGTLMVKDAETSEDKTQELTVVNTCKRDADNGVLSINLSSENQEAALELKVTGFKSSPQTYTCTQAVDNKTAGSLGGKFDTCYVAVKIPGNEKNMVSNGYSMYRDEAEKLQSFTYSGTCQIEVADVAANIKGLVTCNKMIQTYLNGSARNPVDSKSTADVKAVFSCALE